MSGQGAVRQRRSVYAIGSAGLKEEVAVIDGIKDSLRKAPSASHSQSARVAVLLGERNQQFWEIVLDVPRAKTTSEKFQAAEKKILGFAAGCGTILYFDDTRVTDAFAEKFSSYRDHFII